MRITAIMTNRKLTIFSSERVLEAWLVLDHSKRPQSTHFLHIFSIFLHIYQPDWSREHFKRPMVLVPWVVTMYSVSKLHRLD